MKKRTSIVGAFTDADGPEAVADFMVDVTSALGGEADAAVIGAVDNVLVLNAEAKLVSLEFVSLFSEFFGILGTPALVDNSF